jgi:hypothetical protein
MLSEEKLNDFGTRLERSPKKWLSRQSGLAKVELRLIAEVVKVTTQKSVTIYSSLLPVCEARVLHYRWLQKWRFNGLLDPVLTFRSYQAWFTRSGYVSRQIVRYWSRENSYAVHKV